MPKPAKQFIDLLESQQLLAPDILDELRRQVDESKSRLTSELLARLLVDNGHLTKFQATKLIADLKDAQPTAAAGPKPVEQELGFAEDAIAAEGLGGGAGQSQVAQVFVDDDTPVVGGAKPGAAEVPAQKVRPLGTIPIAKAIPVVEALPVAEAIPIAARGRSKSRAGEAADIDTTRPLPVVRPAKPKANPYDSFRVLGVGLILALVLVAGFFLVYFFWRGNADERLQRADGAYEQRSYETASAMYREFAEVFPANEKASYAKVRAGLAAIRLDAEGAPDPKMGLKTAEQVLPGLTGESALTEQQGDLAGALIALAGKFTQRADRAETTAERKLLMDDMQRLMSLIDDPQFVGTNQRNQQAPTLSRIEEDRQRILREINRDEELAAALKNIDDKLAAQDTLAVYDIRKELINRYPLLEADAPLAQRVVQASDLQRSLVKPTEIDLQTSSQAPLTTIGRSFILANRNGGMAAELKGELLFVKAKGAMYGLNGENGDIVWRQFVGRDFDSQPLRLGAGATADAIVCQPQQGEISRLRGSDGQTVWYSQLGSAVYNPTLVGDDLYVAAVDGVVASVEGQTGKLRWAMKLPQTLAASPAAVQDNPQLYVAGDHSNVYVMSRADGACQQVFYVGHRAGAISVPPVWMLGHLFVFENSGAQTSKIHVLSTSDDGLSLQAAQVPLTMEGNVMTPPQIDGRRLIVQTDLGQIKVLDIEPTAKSQQVSELITNPKNGLEPKQSWLLADNNRVWVVGQQLTRFDVRLAALSMSRAWIKNDGDRFVGPPQRFGNTLVHARTQRGTQGIRIAAVSADSGQAYWETDLGTPIVHIARAASGGYDAVNSSAMLYTLENQPIRTTATENPGQGKQPLLFGQPTQIADGRVVLLNAARDNSRGNQLAVVSAESPKIRLLSANFGSAEPSCPATAVGNNLAVGLDSGQLVLLDLRSAAIVGAPYQPAVEAGQRVKWNQPVYVEASQSLIAASDLQQLVRLSATDGLRLVNEVTLPHPLVGPLVTVGDQVAGVQATSAGDILQWFDAMSLQAGASRELPGRLVAGPYATAAGCLVQTDGRLTMISDQGDVRWSIPFAPSMLLGPPLESDGKLIVGTRTGQVVVIQGEDGQVVGTHDVGQTLSSPPLLAGASLLVGSDEGAVLAIPLPKSVQEPPQ